MRKVTFLASWSEANSILKPARSGFLSLITEEREECIPGFWFKKTKIVKIRGKVDWG